MNENDGFELPVHRSLTEPMLLAGVPRSLATINGVFMLAIGLGGQSLVAIPIGIAFHAALAVVTKIDPNFFQVLSRSMARSKHWSG